jgi:ATP synthase protein I
MTEPVTPTSTPHAGAPFAAMVKGAYLPAGLVGIVLALAYFVTVGAESGWSALLGTVVTIAFFSAGLLLLSRLVRSADPHAFFAVAMAIYLAQVIALIGFIIVFKGQDWVDGKALGVTALVVTIVWQGFAMVALRRARIPVYDEAPTEPGEQR